MIQGISIDEIKNLAPDSPAWIAINEANDNEIGIGDKDANKPVIMIFIKVEDARHYARLLRKHSSKNTLVDIREIQLHPYIEAVANNGKMNVVVIGPDRAMEFFKTFEDSLYEYYE